MVALALAMALSGLFFLSLFLFPRLAHWMLAMVPVRLLFLGLILCLGGAPCAVRALCTRCSHAVRKVGSSPPPGVR